MATKRKEDGNPILTFILSLWAAITAFLSLGNDSVDKVVHKVILVCIVLAVLGALIPMGIDGFLTLWHLFWGTIGSVLDTIAGLIDQFNGIETAAPEVITVDPATLVSPDPDVPQS